MRTAYTRLYTKFLKSTHRVVGCCIYSVPPQPSGNWSTFKRGMFAVCIMPTRCTFQLGAWPMRRICGKSSFSHAPAPRNLRRTCASILRTAVNTLERSPYAECMNLWETHMRVKEAHNLRIISLKNKRNEGKESRENAQHFFAACISDVPYISCTWILTGPPVHWHPCHLEHHHQADSFADMLAF